MPGLILQARRRPCDEDADRASGAQDAEREVRVGFTVSRKVGNAVARNRAKRRLRAIAAEVLPTAGRSGFDYVIIGRKGTLGRSFEDLREDLSEAVRRLRAEGDGRKARNRSAERRPRGRSERGR
jgi:ribonuclease P protein component